MSFPEHLTVVIQYIYVFLEIPPILTVVVNIISFATLRRSDQLQAQSSPFRQDISVGLALGAALNVATENAIIFARKFMFHTPGRTYDSYLSHFECIE